MLELDKLQSNLALPGSNLESLYIELLVKPSKVCLQRRPVIGIKACILAHSDPSQEEVADFRFVSLPITNVLLQAETKNKTHTLHIFTGRTSEAYA